MGGTLNEVSKSGVTVIILKGFLYPSRVSSSPFTSCSVKGVSSRCSLALLCGTISICMASSLTRSFKRAVVRTRTYNAVPIKFSLKKVPSVVRRRGAKCLTERGSVRSLGSKVL